jgi:hypothetical protein
MPNSLSAWTNNLPEPTYEKIDRILMDSDWEDKFPMVTVCALERSESLLDHAPILMTTGSTRPYCARQFKLNLDDYTWMVLVTWLSPYESVLLLVGPQLKPGIIKYALCVNTWVVGRHIQPAFKKEKL